MCKKFLDGGIMTDKDIFLNLLKSELLDVLLNDNIVVDKHLENITLRHKCIPFVYSSCVKNNIPYPKLWQYNIMYLALDNEKKFFVQDDLCKILNDNNITFAILKGASILPYYKNPDLRALGDIDILVRENDYESVKELFSKDYKIEHGHGFHFSFVFEGVNIEIHKFITHNFDDFGKNINDLMKDALNEISVCEFKGHKFPTLSLKHQSLMLLTHKKRHLDKNNFIFRMFIDWVCFVKSMDVNIWANTIYPYIKKANLAKFADSLNVLAEKNFDIKINIKKENDFTDCFLDDLFDIMFSSGMGEFEGNITSNVASVYANQKSSNKFVSIIKMINDIAKRKYKLAKLKVFLPVFWIYIPIKYFVQLIFGKREALDINKVNELSRKRKRVYKEIKFK